MGGRSPAENTPGSLAGLRSPSLQLPAASFSDAEMGWTHWPHPHSLPAVSFSDAITPRFEKVAPPLNNEHSEPVELSHLLGRTSGSSMVQTQAIGLDKEQQQPTWPVSRAAGVHDEQHRPTSWPVSRAACIHDEALHCATSAQKAFLARQQRIRGRNSTARR